MGTKRQVILIMTDGQRADMLGCYGNRTMKTPHLDRLAASGTRYNAAYSCQPVCGPARSALFTGTFPHTNGAVANSMPLGGNVKTIGQRLADTGMRTAYVGKWHLDGGDYFGTGQCPAGWNPEYWYDMRRYLEELTPAERIRSRDPRQITDPGVPAAFTYGHRCSNRAIDYLNTYGADDFFLVVSYDEPHHPYLCPEPYVAMHRGYAFPASPNVYDSLETKPAHQRVWAEHLAAEGNDDLPQLRMHELFACNSFIDAEIGRVLEAAARNAPEALIVYTSDHGIFLHSHRLSDKGPAMYEEITRIPFLVSWPGEAPKGTVSPQLVSHIDVVPTVLDYFGLPRSKTLEGASLLPLFRAPDRPVNDAVFMEFTRYEVDHDTFGGFQPIRACRDTRYKLVVNLLTTDELYDTEKDPAELTNLIDSPEHETVRNRLHDRLLQWMNDTRDPMRGYYWETRPWRGDASTPRWSYTGMTRQREEDERYEPRQLDYFNGLPITEAVRHI